MSKSCTVEFDGACKGNPGKGGAGAVIGNSNGDVVVRVHKPMSDTTHNRAEFVSQVVRNEVAGRWRFRSENNYEPYSRVTERIRGLDKFMISHVPREYNTEADAEANRAFDT